VALVVTNGNLGVFDHSPGLPGDYAFDFGTDENDPFMIVAAAAGTVIGAEGYSTVQCKDETHRADGTALANCWANANYVLTKHDDDPTADLYMHLASGTEQVGIGTHVCVGQPVGVDGQTGWATKPHLHFQNELAPAIPSGAATPRPGWWFGQSLPISFSDFAVLGSTHLDGVPATGQAYHSSNTAEGCSVPPVIPSRDYFVEYAKDAVTADVPRDTATSVGIVKVLYQPGPGFVLLTACASVKLSGDAKRSAGVLAVRFNYLTSDLSLPHFQSGYWVGPDAASVFFDTLSQCVAKVVATDGTNTTVVAVYGIN
jgi:hypothetical protein